MQAKYAGTEAEVLHWEDVSATVGLPVTAYQASATVQIVACSQRDGSRLWAIRKSSGSVLNNLGEWEHEPLPSCRDEEFLARCRYATPLDARDAYMAYAERCGERNSERQLEPTQKQIGDVLTTIGRRADEELLALDETTLAGQWYWRWEAGRSIEWNIYRFSDVLEMHKRRCRRWEEHHNGSCCVVERVRDKYVMPRVREFLTALATHNDSPLDEPLSGISGDRHGM